MDESRIRQLQAQIEDLKLRWPKHSVPPALIEQLDDLEEQLAEALKATAEDGDAQADQPD